ncbi:MAG: SMC family ATPase [Candidatus Thermoplasmatota archaeon]|nr:SMC family ATPase [Candidatus Thermoplasmatota archaeon]
MSTEVSIERLAMENIRSYKKADISFLKKGIVVIEGDIAAGKSSILRGINYALFGTNSGNKPESLLRQDCTYGSITLWFEVNGEHVRIKRKITKKKNKTIQDSKIEYEKDGVLASRSPADMDKEIEKLLDIPSISKSSSIWNYSIFLKQEYLKSVLEGANSKTKIDERVDLIRKALNLERYKNASSNADMIITHKIRKMVEELEIKTKNFDSLKEQLENINKDIDDINKKILDETLLKNKYDKDYRDANAIYEEKNSEYQKEISNFETIDKLLNNYKMEKNRNEKRINNDEEALKNLNERIKQLSELKEPKKPEYAADIDHLKSYRKRYSEIDHSYTKYTSGLEELSKNLEELNKDYTDYCKIKERKQEQLINEQKNNKEEFDKLSIVKEVEPLPFKLTDTELIRYRNVLRQESDKLKKSVTIIEHIDTDLRNQKEKYRTMESLSELKAKKEEKSREHDELDKKIGEYKKEIKQFEDLIKEGICPICRRDIDKTDYIEKKKSKEAELVELDRQSIGIKREIGKIEELLGIARDNDRLRETILKKENELKNEISVKDKIEKNIDNIIKELEKQNIFVTIDNFDKVIENYRVEWTDHLKKLDDWNKTVKYREELEKRIEKIKKELEELDLEDKKKSEKIKNTEELKKEYIKNIEKYEKEIKNLIFELSDKNINVKKERFYDMLDEYIKEAEQYNKELDSWKRNIIDLKEKEVDREKIVTNIEKEKKELDSLIIETEKNEKLKKEYEQKIPEMKKEVAEYKLMRDDYLDKAHRQELSLTRLETNLKRDQEDRNKKEKEIYDMELLIKKRELLENYRKWIKEVFIKVLDTIEKTIIGNARIDFNERFKSIIEQLLPYIPFNVKVDEDFTPVVDYGGIDIGLDDGPSGGERSSIALAYRFALYEVTKASHGVSGIIILDEPTDGFSDEQFKKFGEVINSSLSAKQKIIVTHHINLKYLGNMIIELQKENNETITNVKNVAN